ncbi:hypothetical protein IFM89_028220 [Coptis chinensis]|uniref:CASP-like protein n=1 Tax=Coptis chinensis TaxID=261450 RepID=A0A835IT34_9MAGN|nr:hypothetical protein IFM89_028220 [Coptis chinensis]
MDGIERTETGGIGVKVANPSMAEKTIFILRFLAIITSLVAIIVLAVSKQSKPVGYYYQDAFLPPIVVVATARWQYLSSLVFLMVANVLAFVYATISLTVSLAYQAGLKGFHKLTLTVLDLIIMALWFSASGAATDVAVLAYNGNSKAGWNKTCSAYGYICSLVISSIVVSMIGALIFLVLIVVTIVNLHKRPH